MAMPSSTRCGSLSSTARSMKAPGSPSSPLQMTYLVSPGWARPSSHFRPVGKPAPPQAAFENRADLRGGRHGLEAGVQGQVAVAGQVIVQIERVDFAAVL